MAHTSWRRHLSPSGFISESRRTQREPFVYAARVANGRKTARGGVRTRPLALAYVRVSTDEQATDGASLDAQRAALIAEVARRGWDAELVADEGASGKNLDRPGLTAALERLDRGDADALIAVRLDRISRSVADFAALMRRAQRRNWRLVLLSPDLDTQDPAGRFTAHVLAAAAEYERDLIGSRTREGMAQRRREGVHVGRRPTLPTDVVAQIVTARAEGASLRAIADTLNTARTPTAHGGASWHASTIRAVLASTSAHAFRNAPTNPNPATRPVKASAERTPS